MSLLLKQTTSSAFLAIMLKLFAVTYLPAYSLNGLHFFSLYFHTVFLVASWSMLSILSLKIFCEEDKQGSLFCVCSKNKGPVLLALLQLFCLVTVYQTRHDHFSHSFFTTTLATLFNFPRDVRCGC